MIAVLEDLALAVGGRGDREGRESVGEVDGGGENAVVDLGEGRVLVAHEVLEPGPGRLEHEQIFQARSHASRDLVLARGGVDLRAEKVARQWMCHMKHRRERRNVPRPRPCAFRRRHGKRSVSVAWASGLRPARWGRAATGAARS